MSYIEESLSNGESINKIFEHHWIVKFLIFLNFLLGVLTIFWLIPAIVIWLKWKYTENGVTNKRVIHKHGIISRVTDEIRLSAIESIQIQQSFCGRLFGYGDVIVAGRGHGEVVIRWIVDPLEAKKLIENSEYEIQK